MSEAYDELLRRSRSSATLYSVAGLLGWEQETLMPPRAARFRAEQLAVLGELAHRNATSPRVGELLELCEADASLTADPLAAANLRELRRDYSRATRLPAELVAEISETGSLAMEAWKQARRDNDFEAFRPWLQKQLDLNRRKAECYGVAQGGELYDALLEDYEPGMTAAELERILHPLRDALLPLIADVARSDRRPPQASQQIELPLDRQREFHRIVLQRLGFDLDAGRFDVSVHPFCSGIGPGDTRITTRFRKDQFADALGSTMHECGHALYEQGLPKHERWGQPLSEPAGLGIHESQSRLWENHVGRSRAFWLWAYPVAREVFGSPLDAFSAEELYQAVNLVQPNLIRIESDEATYNLHILLRFDLERALLTGDLAVEDLPGAWNERIARDLGLQVPDDARGCLQDVHWSMGSIGYFPTYTLGNLYAAQFWETIAESLPDLDRQIAAGEFGALLEWLRANIHRHGRRLRASDLCRELTGRPLSHEPLMRHLDGKFRALYGVE